MKVEVKDESEDSVSDIESDIEVSGLADAV